MVFALNASLPWDLILVLVMLILNVLLQEVEYAKSIMRQLKCPIIDVSNKAIEETANKIMEIVCNNATSDRAYCEMHTK